MGEWLSKYTCVVDMYVTLCVLGKVIECSGSGVELQTLESEDPSFFTVHCCNSLSCINEYLAIDSGGYMYEQPLRMNYGIWLDASRRR